MSLVPDGLGSVNGLAESPADEFCAVATADSQR